MRKVRKKTILVKPGDTSKQLSPQQQEELSSQQWGEYLKMNDSIMGDLLLGQFKSTVKCLTCQTESVTFQSGYNLALEVPDNVEECSLYDCIDFYMQEDKLEWFCPNCKKMTNSCKWSELFKLPPILIVMLKRFKYDEELEGFRKVETLVNLDMTGVELADYIKSSYFNESNSTYHPYAFVVSGKKIENLRIF